MNTKYVVFLLMIFINISNLSAREQITKFYKVTEKSTLFAMVFSTQTLVKIDFTKIKNGELQTKLKSKYFSSTNQAEEYLLENKFRGRDKSVQRFLKKSFTNTEVKNTSLWPVTKQWNKEFELGFSQWLKTNFDKDFFVKYNLATDCADALIAIRWIYSREMGLPMGSTLAGSEILFSQDSVKKEWAQLPTHNLWHKDKRFLKVLEYVMNNTYTHTLFKDSYPVSISPDHFGQGVYKVSISGRSGHTQIFSHADFSGKGVPLKLLSSTVPKAVRPLIEEVYMGYEAPRLKKMGLFRHRWIYKKGGVWRFKSKVSHPFYSLEQYDEDFANVGEAFSLAVFRRLAPNFKPRLLIEQLLVDLKNKILSRKEVVIKGFKFCSENPCELGTLNYDDWSTPSRDKHIRESFEVLLKLVEKFKWIDPDLEKIFKTIYEKKEMSWGDELVSLEQLEFLFSKNILASDPNKNPHERWADNPAAISQNIINKMKSLITKRKQIIKKGSEICLNSACVWGDANFKQSNTLEFDRSFDGLFSIHNSYCDVFDFDKCSITISEILDNTTVDFLIGNMSILNSLKRIPFLSHHPKDTLENRWGDNWAFHNSYIFDKDATKITVLKNGIGVVSQKTIINLKTKETLYKAEGENKLLVSNNQSFILETSENEVRILDVNTIGKIAQVKLEGIVKAQWVRGDIFSTQQNDGTMYNAFSLFQVKNGLVKKIYEKQGQNFYINEWSKMISYSTKDNNQTLINISDSKVNEINVGKIDLLSCHDYKELETFSVCYISKTDATTLETSTVLIAISRTENLYREISKFSDKCFISSTLDKKFQLLLSCTPANNESMSQLVELNDKLEIVSKKTLFGMPQAFEIAEDLFVISSFDLRKFYYIYNKGILERKKFSNLSKQFNIPNMSVGMISGMYNHKLIVGLYSTVDEYISSTYFLYDLNLNKYQTMNFENRYYVLAGSEADNKYMSLSLYGENDISERWFGNIKDNKSLIPLWSTAVGDLGIVFQASSYGNDLNIKRGEVFKHLGQLIWLDDLN